MNDDPGWMRKISVRKAVFFTSVCLLAYLFYSMVVRPVSEDTTTTTTTTTTTAALATGSKVIYLLHIHKAGGTFLCSSVDRQKKVEGPTCNVPDSLWYSGDAENSHLFGAYFGNTLQKQVSIYDQLKANGTQFASCEGSVEDDFPLLPDKYFYVVTIREPSAQMMSMYLYDLKYFPDPRFNKTPSCADATRYFLNLPNIVAGHNKNKKTWGHGDNFMTRRMCGYSCVHTDVVTGAHFSKALKHLRSFDNVAVTEHLTRSLCMLRKQFSFLHQVQKSHYGWNTSPTSGLKVEDCAEFRQVVRKTSPFDVKLYEEAKKIFEEKVANTDC